MSYKDTVDAFIDEMRAHLKTTANVDLADELARVKPARNAVEKTYGMPIPLSMVPALSLPALSVYRGSTAFHQVGRHELRLTQVRIDYVGPQSAAGYLGEVYPLLSRMFESCIKNLKGWRDSNEYVVEIYHRQAQVRYNFANTAGHANTYPVFSATFPTLHCPDIPNNTPVVGVPFTADIAVSKGPFEVDITTPPEETP